MKDYNKQIMTILKLCLNSDDLQCSGRNELPDSSGISRAVRALNAMIKNEVYELELQIVDLTEQLSETDSLLIEAKKAIIPRLSHSKSRTRIARMAKAEK